MAAVYEGILALGLHNDTGKTLTLSIQAAEIGRQLGVIDLEMLALALEGWARVCAGDIAEGMRRLDESTTAAVSGEITDPDACASACCFLICACEQVRDYDRAAQWCKYIQEFSKRWKYPFLFSFCRTHYAGVLMWRGEWVEAESILIAATNDLIATRPAEAAEGIVRLAELRRRQGRFDEAKALLQQAESHPFRMLGANLVLIARSALSLDLDDAATAVDLAERFLRGLPAEDRLDRSAALELLAMAQIALGAADRAEQTCAELQSIAALVATEPLRASACFVEAAISAARGDHESARRRFEDTLDLYLRNGAPFETAQTRIGLARSLLALGRLQPARQQAQKAEDALQNLGAKREAARAADIMNEIESSLQSDRDKTSDVISLTPREQEILRLVAAGKSNHEIAAALILSVRTVERHISNIYQKIGASGTTARATATAYALRREPTQS